VGELSIKAMTASRVGMPGWRFGDFAAVPVREGRCAIVPL